MVENIEFDSTNDNVKPNVYEEQNQKNGLNVSNLTTNNSNTYEIKQFRINSETNNIYYSNEIDDFK